MLHCANSPCTYTPETGAPDQTMHSKVLTVVAPGGMVVDATMTSNYNAAAVGLAVLDLPADSKHAAAAKSWERFTAWTFPLSSPKGQELISTFCRLWGNFAAEGFLIWNAPVMAESLIVSFTK